MRRVTRVMFLFKDLYSCRAFVNYPEGGILLICVTSAQ